MRAVGLIVEYNPFHNGHAFHLKQSRRISDAEVVVAVMSGHFLQRGEPALVDKWVRTRMALAAGVDLVLELPFVFACNSAPHFATGAVRTLAAVGGVDSLCFGSEIGGLGPLQECATFLQQHAMALKEITQQGVRQGVSYPAARQQLAEDLGQSHLVEVLGQPNNILGLEYLNALNAEAPEISPLTVQRIGAGFHDRESSGGIASATGIRHRLEEGESIAGLLPDTSQSLLDEAMRLGQTIDPARYETAVLLSLQKDTAELNAVYQMNDGLGPKLAEIGRRVRTVPEVIDQLKSRQFTQTRIQRILTYQLLGTTTEEMPSLLNGPFYLRALGMNRRGQAFLAAHRKKRQGPLVTNLSRVYAQLKRFYGRGSDTYGLAERMLELDLKATRVYRLLQHRMPMGPLNDDFYQDVIRTDT